MWLVVDDLRDLDGDIIARNAKSAKSILISFSMSEFLEEKIDQLSLDNDLGGGEEGLDILKWGLSFGIIPNHVQVITMNPPAKVKMQDLLMDNGYVSTNGIDFYKQE